MKTKKSRLLNICALVVVINIQACTPGLLLHTGTIVEYDEVKNVTRFKRNLVYQFSEEFYSPFIRNEQKIVKESSFEGNKYTVYDDLQLTSRLNFIEDTLYFIIDEKIYPIKINFQSSEAFSCLPRQNYKNTFSSLKVLFCSFMVS